MRIPLELAIRKMADVAIEHVKDAQTIGLGSGSTVAEFVRALANYAKERHLQIRIVPSSLQIQMVAEEAGLEVDTSNRFARLDVTIDGADQVDAEFNLIKGGGGALFKERVLMAEARRTIILADETKFSKNLDKPVPVEVSPFARTLVADRLMSLGGRPQIRLNKKGYPYVTENANVVFDADFGVIVNPAELESKIRNMAGVIEVGIFTTNVDIIYKACEDGSVVKIPVIRR